MTERTAKYSQTIEGDSAGSSVVLGQIESGDVISPNSQSISSDLQGKLHYKSPQIYMIPLHEIQELQQGQWFDQLLSILSSASLGYIIPQIGMAGELNLEMGIILVLSLVFLMYQIVRAYKRDLKVADLKNKAIEMNIRESIKD